VELVEGAAPMNPTPERPVVIVGAGVTGLTLAMLLAERGAPSVVIECGDRPGGLARSFRYDGYTFDIGPHRFHTVVPEVDGFIRGVLGTRARTIPRRSRVRFHDQYYPWPLHPTSVLLRFPPRLALAVARDLLLLYRDPNPVSFRDQIISMYGRTLYRHFFHAYSSKFLGVTPELTHADWAKTGVDRAIIDNRLNIRSLRQLLWSLVRPRHDLETTFLYPEGGCDRFIDELARRYRARGGEVLCGRPVEALETRGDRIAAVRVGDREFEPSLVVWTGTLHSLAERLRAPISRLEYLALVCFNLRLTDGPRFDFQWSYHGAPEILFSRVSVPANFDPGNTPAGHRSLCVEVTCHEGDPIFRDPGAFVGRVLDDLKRERLLETDHEVLAWHAERVPWAYPIYRIDYPEALADVGRSVGGIGNLVRAGRLGRYWYNNMDHCIEESLRLSEAILAGRAGS
jgi:protoporphyrinogen oxidase